MKFDVPCPKSGLADLNDGALVGVDSAGLPISSILSINNLINQEFSQPTR